MLVHVFVLAVGMCCVCAPILLCGYFLCALMCTCVPYWPGQDSKTAVLLVLLVIPGSALFLFVVHAMDLGHTVLTPPFMAGYVLAAVFQV